MRRTLSETETSRNIEEQEINMKMKTSLVCLSALLLAGGIQADTFFSLEKVPSVLNATIRPHQDIELMLEENGNAGYAWNAVYDARLCSVSMEHKRPKFPAADGSGGYAKIEIEPVSATPFVVTLVYGKTNAPGAAPLKTMKVQVTPAAPGTVMSVVPTPAAKPVTQAAAAQTAAVQTAAVQTAAVQTVAVTPAGAQLPSVPVPLLIDDQKFRLNALPPVLQANLFAGQDIDFELEENPEANFYWRVVKYDPTFCRIKLEHDRGGFWSSPEAEIEIKALRSGTTEIEFAAGSGASARTLRCIVTIQ